MICPVCNKKAYEFNYVSFYRDHYYLHKLEQLATKQDKENNL